MQSGFREYFKDSWALLAVNARQSYEIDTAYFFNNWAGLFSTLAYTVTYIIFIGIVFANVKTLGSFDQNQMYFLMFIAQLHFYGTSVWSTQNLKDLIDDINTGALDLLLIKPVPSLLYVTFRRIYWVDFFREGSIPLIVLGLLINWSSLDLQLGPVLAAIVVFFCGQIAYHVIQFMLMIPTFWTGHSEQLFNLSYSLTSADVIPYDGIPRFFQITFRTILPIFIATAVCASVALGKLSILHSVVSCLAVAIAALILKRYAWNASLRNYSSASS